MADTEQERLHKIVKDQDRWIKEAEVALFQAGWRYGELAKWKNKYKRLCKRLMKRLKAYDIQRSPNKSKTRGKVSPH